MKNPKIVTIGLSYKPDVADLRESQAIEIVHILKGKGYDIRDYEPLVQEKSYDSLASNAKGADCVAILVEHTAVIKELQGNVEKIKAAMRTPIIMRF